MSNPDMSGRPDLFAAAMPECPECYATVVRAEDYERVMGAVGAERLRIVAWLRERAERSPSASGWAALMEAADQLADEGGG